MQQFLLNDRVITESHMKSIDARERTKYAKKYDMPSCKLTPIVTERNIIQSLLEKQRKALTKTKNDEIVAQNSPKTKNLFSILKIDEFFVASDQKISDHKSLIKESCFTVRGIKKDIKQLCITKKGTNRTCSLISTMRFAEHQFGTYDVNSDIRFKRSPRCFISPKAQNLKKEERHKFHLLQEKENISLDQNDDSPRYGTKQKQKVAKLTIKEMVDKEIEEQIKKRKAICRTAPTKHLQKMNTRQELAQQYEFLEEDICKVEAKIYSEMRQNRQKALRRNKQRIGININKNKPFTSSQINKNTVKLLKKYHCDNMVYFSKFVTKD